MKSRILLLSPLILGACAVWEDPRTICYVAGADICVDEDRQVPVIERPQPDPDPKPEPKPDPRPDPKPDPKPDQKGNKGHGNGDEGDAKGKDGRDADNPGKGKGRK